MGFTNSYIYLTKSIWVNTKEFPTFFPTGNRIIYKQVIGKQPIVPRLNFSTQTIKWQNTFLVIKIHCLKHKVPNGCIEKGVRDKEKVQYINFPVGKRTEINSLSQIRNGNWVQ